jgi:hypothetical protein
MKLPTAFTNQLAHFLLATVTRNSSLNYSDQYSCSSSLLTVSVNGMPYFWDTSLDVTYRPMLFLECCVVPSNVKTVRVGIVSFGAYRPLFVLSFLDHWFGPYELLLVSSLMDHCWFKAVYIIVCFGPYESLFILNLIVHCFGSWRPIQSYFCLIIFFAVYICPTPNVKLQYDSRRIKCNCVILILL